MNDFRTAREKRKGYTLAENAKVPCIVFPDGLMVYFLRKDVEQLLDSTYPHEEKEDRKVWYFNETKDREIAETAVEADRILANPRILWDHYL